MVGTARLADGALYARADNAASSFRAGWLDGYLSDGPWSIGPGAHGADYKNGFEAGCIWRKYEH